jgi:hypothetical protein
VGSTASWTTSSTSTFAAYQPVRRLYYSLYTRKPEVLHRLNPCRAHQKN